MRGFGGLAKATVLNWYDNEMIHDHWHLIREGIIGGQPIDPGIVLPIVDCALFLDDEIVLAKGLRIISEGATPGKPLFAYAIRNISIDRIARLFGIYQDRFPRNPHVAKYVASLIGVSGLRQECSEYLLSLQSVLPTDRTIAKVAVKALSLAGREQEGLPMLEGLAKAGQLDKVSHLLLDRILVNSGDLERAEEIFEQAAGTSALDFRFIADAISLRDKALAVEAADRIQRKYLDQLSLNDEIAEWKIRRYLELRRFDDAMDIAATCSRIGIGNPSIAALKRRCQSEMVMSLSRAGREKEALPILEDLRSTGQLDKAGWMLLDRILVNSGDFEKAEEIFERGAALYGRDFGFIASAIRSRDKALAVEAADRIQRDYLDQLSLNAEIVQIKMRRLFRVHRFDDALSIASACMKEGMGNQAIAALGTQCYLELGMPDRAAAFLDDMQSCCGVIAREGWGLLEYLGHTARYPQAREHISFLESSGKASLLPKGILEKWKAEISVFDDTARILSRFPTRAVPRGVVVLFTHGASLMHLWMGLTAAELKKSGFAVVFPYQYGCCAAEMTGDPEIDRLHGVLDFSMKRLVDEREGIPERRFQWTIDPDRGIVAACGLNFFQPIIARIGTILRRYRFSFDHPIARATLEAHISTADAMLALCERIRHTLGRRNIPVRFLASMTHYIPAAVLRQYCDAHGNDVDMNYVAFASAYEDYYTNLSNDRTGALSMRNLTKHKDVTAPGRVTASEFESWMRQLSNADRKDIRSQVMAIISFDRTKRSESRDAALVLERIRNHKSAGGKVACLFGKILYDIWSDEPAGVVHADIADWLNHSIEAVAGSDTLLLIKPHPNEINPLIAAPSELFSELMKSNLNNNVILCQHKWFNVGDLVQYLDLGLLWSGTAGLELQACGVPVLMCGRWGLRDHPVPFVQARDRGHYETMLRHPGTERVSEEVRERCLLLLKYYSSPEVMIPYAYGNMRYLRKKDIGPPCWHMDKVEQYFKHGDPYVELMARSCL